MRRIISVVFTLTLLGVAALGCAGLDVPGDPDQLDAVDGDGKADQSAARPLGSFVAGDDVELGDIATVTLAEDRSFARRIQVVDCLPAAACRPETGSYKLTRSTTSAARYIRFYDADGDFMDRYAYTYVNGVLKLRLDSAKRWVSYDEADCRSVGCNEGRHCSPCRLGSYTCVPDGSSC